MKMPHVKPAKFGENGKYFSTLEIVIRVKGRGVGPIARPPNRPTHSRIKIMITVH